MKSLAALALSVCTAWAAFAQNVTVKGIVTDEQNEPMIAAGVVQKGTTNGTVSDIDGSYVLTVPRGATVLFSTIGYIPQEVVVNENMTLNIKMEPDNQMIEETVVVGYGVQRKSDVTGSISQVKSEDIRNRTITTPEGALQGKTTGVQVFSSSARPGASPTIRIRGISSNGSSDPLYVVDGRITTSISGIDPSDIESMEVLKDGASAAIYGARAGNGVILITTRKGAGEGKISYSFQLSSQSLAKTPKVMNSEQYIQYYVEQGKYSQEAFYRNWDFETNTDWINYCYEPSIMQHHNLTFAAGNDRGSLYLSGSYLDNNGMFAGDNDVYQRLTFMVNGSWKFKPWIDVQTNNQVEYYNAQTISEGNEYGSTILASLVLDPLTPTVYTGNLPSHIQSLVAQSELMMGKDLMRDENGNIYGISYWNDSGNVNPRIMRDQGHSETHGFNINGATALNFRPLRDLTITSRIGYRMTASDSYGYSLPYYVNGNAQQDFVSLSGSESNSVYYQWENFANYMKQIGKHNITAMAGMSYAQTRSFSMSGGYTGQGNYYDDNGNPLYDLGVLQQDPLFYYFGYATAVATKSVSGAEPMYYRNLSYFARAGWNYLGRYNLQASFRADAADQSILPIAKRWGYFPSISAGWTISEEDFFAPLKGTVNYLKFRVSWGQNGNTASLGNYMYANTIGSVGYYPTSTTQAGQYITGYAPSYSGNDELKWETSEQFNIGVDMRFLRDRLTFNVDWYRKMTKDLIVTGITPSTVVGVDASPVNAGNVVNRGLELELRWRDQIGKDFHYGISANLSTLHNEVTHIHESLPNGIDGASIYNFGTVTRFETGYPAWHFIGYEFTGIDPDTGNAMFNDYDGISGQTDGDKVDLGSGIPKVNAGLTLNASYKGFDATVFMTGAWGQKILYALDQIGYAVNKVTYFTEDRWTPTHTNATMPAAGASNWTQFYTSSGVLFKGDYVKVKQIQLGYTLPQQFTKRFRVDNLRIYGSLDDWFTFTEYPGFDPEVTGVGSSLGIDRGSYPTSKKLVFGVNLTF